MRCVGDAGLQGRGAGAFLSTTTYTAVAVAIERQSKDSLRTVVVPVLAKAAVRAVVSVDDLAARVPFRLEVGNRYREDVMGEGEAEEEDRSG